MILVTTGTRIHLMGGGVDTVTTPALLAPFTEAASARASGRDSRPRLVLVLADDTGLAARFRPAYVEALEALAPGGLDVVDVFVDGSRPFDPAVLSGADGLVVGGGPTPVYLDALVPAAPALRRAVGAGLPYLGFSAGAMVAASTALAGGWRQDGRAVCDESWSEGFDDLELRPGLGLTPFTVDVHVAQGGLLGRTASLPLTAGVERALGIDEDTCLSLCPASHDEPTWQVHGRGSVWDVTRGAGDAVLVRRLVAR
jgi:cyanophycinase